MPNTVTPLDDSCDSLLPPGFEQRTPADDDLAGIRQLYPPSSVPQGTYALYQQQTFRFLDAHESRSATSPP